MNILCQFSTTLLSMYISHIRDQWPLPIQLLERSFVPASRILSQGSGSARVVEMFVCLSMSSGPITVPGFIPLIYQTSLWELRTREEAVVLSACIGLPHCPILNGWERKMQNWGWEGGRLPQVLLYSTVFILWLKMYGVQKGREERFDNSLIIGARSYSHHIALLSKVTIKPASKTQVWSCKQPSNMMLTKILTIYTAYSSVHPACNPPSRSKFQSPILIPSPPSTCIRIYINTGTVRAT
jgi:hypothetical protein